MTEQQPITVGTATAAPGTVARGVIEVAQRPAGGSVSIPVIVVNGSRPGPTLWIDGAIHGDEPEGPLSLLKLVAQIDPQDLSGCLVAVPVMNVGAFEAAERGNPADTFSYDMNRIYPGRADGYYTDRVAWAHFQAMKDVADMEISIHSGGGHSYLSETIFYADGDRAALELAQAMGRGWKLILKSFLPKGSPPAVMHDAQKAAITVELGGRCRTLPAEIDRVAEILCNAFLNVMRHYAMIDGEPAYESTWWTGKQHALLAGASGLYIANPDIQFQQPLKKGDCLATIVDLYGDELAQVTAPVDGMIFGLRSLNTVQMGDWCCFYAEIEGEIEGLMQVG
ncbi:MAG: succinylglutamate desuccinylase/aspartoacylase family protein [Caldilineaceae bacterium]|nr:succinylglutamate desuccinylase/aspartoacylase family protein [Caldilineaceae bacterium]